MSRGKNESRGVHAFCSTKGVVGDKTLAAVSNN